MNAITIYQDLCAEIDMLEYRIARLEDEYKVWYNACFSSRHPSPLDINLKHMERICDLVEAYATTLDEKLKEKQELEKRISQLESIDYKVCYLRDIKGMTLPEIAAELNYSIDWIKRISARNKRRLKTDYTKSTPNY